LKKYNKESLPIHHKDYDRIQQAEGPIKSAVSIGLTDEDRSRLAKDLRVTRDFARFFNDLRRKDSQIRRELRELPEALKQRLEAFGAQIEAMLKEAWMTDRLTAVGEFLERAQASEMDKESVRKAIDEIENVRGLIKDVQNDLKTLRSTGETSSATPEDAILSVLSVPDNAMTTLTDRVGKLTTAAQTVLEGIRSAYKVLRSTLTVANLANEAQQLLQALGETTDDAFQGLIAEVKKYPEVYARISEFFFSLLHAAQESRVAAASKDDKVDPRVIERMLNKIVDTEININNTPPDSGDTIHLQVELIGPTDDQTISHEQDFAVQRFGLYNKLDAHLIFVDGIDEPGTGPETNFEAAPSASWSLHYRMRERGNDAYCWAECFNTVDLGIGFNVAALQFENDGVEIGVGPHLTLFGDLLQFGFGWNLNVHDDREYMFVGIGLVEALNIASLGIQNVTSVVRSDSAVPE
jgi:hypothetical protein